MWVLPEFGLTEGGFTHILFFFSSVPAFSNKLTTCANI